MKICSFKLTFICIRMRFDCFKISHNHGPNPVPPLATSSWHRTGSCIFWGVEEDESSSTTTTTRNKKKHAPWRKLQQPTHGCCRIDTNNNNRHYYYYYLDGASVWEATDQQRPLTVATTTTAQHSHCIVVVECRASRNVFILGHDVCRRHGSLAATEYGTTRVVRHV
jgi:hypothetical protein